MMQITKSIKLEDNNIDPILRRAFIFLEDNEFDRADEYAEKVLDINPECADAYIVKLMAEFRISNYEDLKNQSQPFDDNINYKKIIRYGDEQLKNTLKNLNEYICARNKESFYCCALEKMQTQYYEAAIEYFKKIPSYKDVDKLINECKEFIYYRAEQCFALKNYDSALKIYQVIAGYKDADKKVLLINKLLTQKKEKHKLIKRKIIISAILMISILVPLIVILRFEGKYRKGEVFAKEGSLYKAYSIYDKLGGYRDSSYRAYILEEYRIELKNGIHCRFPISENYNVLNYNINNLNEFEYDNIGSNTINIVGKVDMSINEFLEGIQPPTNYKFHNNYSFGNFDSYGVLFVIENWSGRNDRIFVYHNGHYLATTIGASHGLNSFENSKTLFKSNSITKLKTWLKDSNNHIITVEITVKLST